MVIAAMPSFRTDAFIDGAFRPAQSGARFTTENPATGQPLAEVAAGDAADIDLAVRAARRAFDDGRWSRRSPADRKAVLLAFADRLEANADELAMLDSLEAGKPITDCREVDVPDAIHTFRWFAEAIDKVFDAVAPTGPEALGLIVREPIGVVGAVVPWNFPMLMATWKLAPALAAGNSVIVKPARLTSLSAIRMAELAAEAGLPAGVFNVVPGSGETAGQALGRHMDVDMVTFTGSTEVGRSFLKYSAESNLKEIALECGGKSPQLVLASAPDLDFVAEQVLVAGLMNMGENCSCGSRLIVDRSVHDALVERLVAGMSAWTVGDPQDPATRLGPMIERPHLEQGALVHRCGPLGRRARGRRRRPHAGGDRRLLRRPDDPRRRAEHDDRRPRGDLRAGDLDRSRSIPRRRRWRSPTRPPTVSPPRSTRPTSTRRSASPARCAPGRSGSMPTPRATSRRRSAGTRNLGFGGRDKGLEAFEQYTEKKTIWFALRG